MAQRTRVPVYPRVVEEMKKQGYRPGHIAALLDMTVENFAHHIAGHHGMRFNLRELDAMARLFNVTMDDLKGQDNV